MSDIFISYSSEDRVETIKLAHALESQGWSVWWDRSIPIGKSYEVVIEEVLDEAKCVLVIWSETSIKSQWVRAEAAEAQRQGKLFPLNIDDCNPPLVYRALQTADFKDWSGETTHSVFKQLATALHGHIKTTFASTKTKSNSKIIEEEKNYQNIPNQHVSSVSSEISNIETNYKQNTIGRIISKEVSNSLGNVDTPLHEAKSDYEIKEQEKTNSPQSPKTSKIQKTRWNDGTTKKNIKTPFTATPSAEQSTQIQKEHNKPKWITLAFTFLTVLLLIGVLLLLEKKYLNINSITNKNTILAPNTDSEGNVNDAQDHGTEQVSLEDYAKKLESQNIKDSDNDSIDDVNDKCSNTPAGAKVNSQGCWTYGSVEFDNDSTLIKTTYAPLFNNLIYVLKRNPSMTIEVQGHTSSQGSAAYNMALSKRRAQSIKDHLVNNGIDESRLTIKGLGETEPIDSNDTREGRATNNRVNFRTTSR